MHHAGVSPAFIHHQLDETNQSIPNKCAYKNTSVGESARIVARTFEVIP